MGGGIGERFAKALAAKDESGLLDLLAPDLDFRGMTPGRVWEAASALELVHEVIFGHWFEPADRIDALEGVEHGTVVDRPRVSYRLRVTNPDGTYLVEQQAYYDIEDERIVWLRVMCSGYRAVSPEPAG